MFNIWSNNAPYGFKYGSSFETREEAEFYLKQAQERLVVVNKGRVANGHKPLIDDYVIVETDKAWTLDIPEDELLKLTYKFRN